MSLVVLQHLTLGKAMRIAEITAVAAHTRRKPNPANTAAAAPSINSSKRQSNAAPLSSGYTPPSKAKPFNQTKKRKPFNPRKSEHLS